MGLAGAMTYSPGDVVRLDAPRIDPPERSKRRYAVVLSERAYNIGKDHGVLVLIASGAILHEPILGVYAIKDLRHAGLNGPSQVVPWFWTLKWTRVIEKVGELTPYEFREMVARLREVVPL